MSIHKLIGEVLSAQMEIEYLSRGGSGSDMEGTISTHRIEICCFAVCGQNIKL